MKCSLFYFWLAAILLTVGCKVDELTDADIISGEAEFAIPLGKTNTTVEDLLENFDSLTSVEIAPDNVIHLIYKGDILRQEATEFLSAAGDSVPPIVPLINTNYFALPFSSPEVLEVDKAIFKTGVISIAVSSSEYAGPVKLIVTLPQVSENGQPLTFESTFQSPITGPLEVVQLPETETDVSGYEMVPEDGNIIIQYEALTQNGLGEPITLDIVALFNVGISFGYIEGYLGDVKHNGDRDTIDIDFFDSWTQGDVFFDDPLITFNIENSFGVPTRSVIEIFDILTADGRRIPLRSDFIDTVEGIDFAFPEVPGDVANMTFHFDVSNSNIDTVLGSRPIALDYDVDARMNPDTIVDLRGFITDESYYNIQVEVDLPLHGRASGFEVTDEFDIDFNSYTDVKEAEFKLVADNGMPFDIDGQAYFLDRTGAILDSLFDTGKTRIIGAGEVDSDGFVVSVTTQTTFAKFDADRFENIRQAKKISLRSFFSTFNNGQQSVRASAGQETEIRMGLKLTVE